MSPNSSAEVMRSPRSESSVPSSVMSSMMSWISSSVTETSGSPLTMRLARLPIAERTAVAGVQILSMIIRGPMKRSARSSLYFFAMLLGSISAKKNTIREVAIVEIVTAESPKRRVTYTVTSDAVERWAMFVQMRIVLIVRSKLSSAVRTEAARSSPWSARVFIFTLEQDARAVSTTAM